MAESIMIEKLTPLDLIMPGTYVQAFFAFPCLSPDLSIPNLQQGLSRLCEKYPWLRGRVLQGSRANLHMQWKSSDLPPILTDNGIIESSYDHLAAQGMPPASIPPEKWPQISVSGTSSTACAPIFAASFSRFAGNSGLALCICVHHNVVDAAGLSHLLHDWASYCNDPLLFTTAFDEDRLVRFSGALGHELDAASQQSLKELFSSHSEYSQTPPQLPEEFAAATSKVFRICAAQLNSIKKNMSDAVGAAPSTNTLLCALMWRAVTKARTQRNPSLAVQTSNLVTAVDGRGRISPNFSHSERPYLGNVVLYAITNASVEGLNAGVATVEATNPLADICELIDQAQSSTRIDRRFIADVYSLKSRLDDTIGMFPGWDLFHSKDLTITSWRHLDLYTLDFGSGLGCPSFVRPPHVAADGVGFVLPRKQLSGMSEEILEVMIMLREDDLECLVCDEQWKDILEDW